MDASATPDLAALVVADPDGTVAVWEVDDQPQRRHVLPHDDVPACVPVGSRIVVSAALDGWPTSR